MQGLGFEPRHPLRDTPLKRARLTTSLPLRNKVRFALAAGIFVDDCGAPRCDERTGPDGIPSVKTEGTENEVLCMFKSLTHGPDGI